ncbi:hypothetical protein MycrhN_5536 [Mycolicibacterium rhodesiae NBB3]|uniref:Secreted protein n=1 Tax=Mycolicibacterium rhodesiae (strain NBB3) TaxID=710685 RepID=G8RJR4_MYCRN|nr:hypothetical protein [Mycolicibacterium rhodesiae]AEV76005.1 hypothetical protein MycrhN_5536 [Mycolicibacterium rhodesiae NBB3]
MSLKALITTTLPLVALAMAPSAVAQPPGGSHCPPRDGQSVVITVGDIDCVTAADFAAQYDPNGDKYQQIGPFTCYSGNAMTAPLIFQCVADTEDHAEFGVYPG